MKRKNIIFLDIDGVLAGYEYLKTGKGFIDPECVKKVNRLEEFDAEIVITSSWGYDDGRTEKSLRACGLTLPIIGYTQRFYADWFCRGNEIEKWLHDNCGGMGTKYGVDEFGVPYYKRNHKEDIDYEYIVLDDDSDMLLGQKDNFIKVNRETGITDEDIEKCKQIFLEN